MATVTKSSPSKGDKRGSRGLRNDNPLNIRHSQSKWQGMREKQTDKAFVQFKSRVYGYRAAFVLLRNYIEKHRANTIGKIIARWAPSSDGNNTRNYISFVSRSTGIDTNRRLRFEERVALVEIVRSMAQMESGIIEDASVIAEAYDLASSK